MQHDFTRSEREALKAIYRFTRDGSEAHTGTLAERLRLSPGTVTTLVKRLADRGLVDHRPYQGVRFTGDGRRAAVAAIRVHRIVERFLADMLGYARNEAGARAPPPSPGRAFPGGRRGGAPRRYPGPPHRRALPRRHARLRLERGGRA